MFELKELPDPPKLPMRVLSVGDANDSSLARKLSAESIDDVTECSGEEAPFHVCIICYGRDLERNQERIKHFVVSASSDGVEPTSYLYVGIVDDRDVVSSQVLSEVGRGLGVVFQFADGPVQPGSSRESDLCWLTKNIGDILDYRSSLICYDYEYIREMSSVGECGFVASSCATGERATLNAIEKATSGIRNGAFGSQECRGAMLVLTSSMGFSVEEIEELSLDHYGWNCVSLTFYSVFLDESMERGSRRASISVFMS